MNPRNRILLGAVVVAVLLMVVAPPYYGQMRAGETNIHSNLGHYPVWNPPTPDECRSELIKIFEGTSQGEMLVKLDDLSLYRTGFNKVRFTLNIVIIFCVYGVLLMAGFLRARLAKPR